MTAQQQQARLRPFKPIPFGRYTLLSGLATGGMGEVFLARLEGTSGFEKLCVIKKILPQLAENAEFRQRFLNEARTLVKLSHGAIAQVLDSGVQDGEPFLAIEYVDGKDLRRIAAKVRERQQPMPLTLVLHVMSRVLDALSYAHRKRDDEDNELGLVHRDISPQNILISYEGEVKVIDFGLAKSRLNAQKTHPSIVLGKFLYMAPEQARHQQVDRRTDLYAVGLCLYELLAGKNPFEGVHPGELMMRVSNPQIPPLREVDPLVPSKLDGLVMKALSVDPEERFQSAEEFRTALVNCLYEIDRNVASEGLATFMRETFIAEYQSERRMLLGLRDLQLATLQQPAKSNPLQETGIFNALPEAAPAPLTPALEAAGTLTELVAVTPAASETERHELPVPAKPTPRSERKTLLEATPVGMIAGSSVPTVEIPTAELARSLAEVSSPKPEADTQPRVVLGDLGPGDAARPVRPAAPTSASPAAAAAAGASAAAGPSGGAAGSSAAGSSAAGSSAAGSSAAGSSAAGSSAAGSPTAGSPTAGSSAAPSPSAGLKPISPNEPTNPRVIVANLEAERTGRTPRPGAPKSPGAGARASSSSREQSGKGRPRGAPLPKPAAQAVDPLRHDTPVHTEIIRRAELKPRPTQSRNWLLFAAGLAVPLVLGVASYFLVYARKGPEPRPFLPAVIHDGARPPATLESEPTVAPFPPDAPPAGDPAPRTLEDAAQSEAAPSAAEEKPTEAIAAEAPAAVTEAKTDTNAPVVDPTPAIQVVEPDPREREAPRPPPIRTRRAPAKAKSGDPAVMREWDQTRARFERLTRQQSCSLTEMALVCRRYRALERSVERADSAEGQRELLPRIEAMQQLLADWGG